ncbi:hypothetical protein [Sediminitomix flava]|uniref:Dolichyl-phosphate-mannose-protein mannosyltransferase n=1 Tax=Sediminitomix flava TaxID=379075 RepID=A0A315Z8R5_SEDFL|nr:hypothetical protein [Sediminitomix flava]PWJ39416.1 hypothetical protein BC781_106317 [Sediminitomix flava]
MYDTPLTNQELMQFLIGDALSNDKSLYIDLWTTYPPLSAWFHELVFNISQGTSWGYELFSVLLILIQAFTFNSLLQANEAYNEKTNIPGLLYCIFMLLSPDFTSLPPVLIGLTFLLPALGHSLRPDENNSPSIAFRTGIWLGIAYLAFAQSIWFLLMGIIVNIIYGNGSIRIITAKLYGFFFPVSAIAIYQFFFGDITAFFDQFILGSFSIKKHILHSFEEMFALGVFPAVWLTFAIFKIFSERNYINFQVNIQQIFLFWLMAASVAIMTSSSYAIHQFALFVPVIAFFISHQLLLIRRTWIAETIFTFGTLTILLIGIWSVKPDSPLQKFITYENMNVKKAKWQNLGEKIWVTGGAIEYYEGNHVSLPYIQWDLASKELTPPFAYESLSSIQRKFMKDMPQIIIDKENIIPILFEKIPLIASKYEQIEQQVYQLK